MGDLPFSTDAFFGIFEQYNLAIWPAQPLAYMLGLAALGMAIRPVAGGDRVIAGILASAWILMGAVYHMRFFAQINPAAWLFGGVFVLQGLLFLWWGTVRGRLAFRPSLARYGRVGIGMALFAMAVYPIAGIALGHAWPRSPVFGIAPCPTTIFTLGMLLTLRHRIPAYLAAIPVLWSLVGGSAAFLLGVPEDVSLLAAGILTTILAAVANRRASTLQDGAHLMGDRDDEGGEAGDGGRAS